MLGDDPGGQPAGLPARRPESLGLDAGATQRLECALEVRALLLLGLGEGREVGVGVMGDLVALLENRLDGTRVAVGREARHEEGRRQRVLTQQAEDARHSDERPVGLVRHHAGVPRVEPALAEDRRLGVDVEGQARLDAHGAPPIARRLSSS